MNTLTRNKNLLIASLILASAMAVSLFIVSAEAKGEADITFPVAGLGNCKDKADCKSFCDNAENIVKCVSFAKEHNLISEEEAARADKFAAAGPGPGGCQGVACESYCDDMSHAEECVAFAQEHGFADKGEIERVQKITKILKDGAGMPGGCQGKKECESYCSDTSHAEECLAFAEKAGFMPKEELERARKMIPLMMKGETPGGCKSKDQCEAYCQNDSNFEECLAFAEKSGVVSGKELEMARKTGGKGPGGCKGREQCETFCNNPANQETCFNFAKEHGLIDENEIKNIKEGVGQVRMGMDKAPEEVKSCLKENLGENIVQDIEAGTLTPGPDIGERVRGCFEKFMPKVREKIGGEFNRAPESVRTCLELAVGKEEFEKIKNGEPPKDPSMGDKIKSCFENMGPPENGMIREGVMPPQASESSICVSQKKEEFRKMMEENGGNLPDETRRKMEEAISECLKGERRDGAMPMPPYGIIPEGIREMAPPGVNITVPKIEYEYQKPEYPTMPPESTGSGYPAYPGVLETGVKFSFPPESIDCVSSIYGKEIVEKITIGTMPPPLDVQNRIGECMAKLNPPATQ